MPRSGLSPAVQLDRATLGATIVFMRDQIIANAESMFKKPGQPVGTYKVILSDYQHLSHGPVHPLYRPRNPKDTPHPILLFAAAICTMTDKGTKVLVQGPKEATIWAAYRSLMKLTTHELGKRRDVFEGNGPREPSKSERVLGIY